ncbi:MAG TPA: ABC transporter permease [Thermoanaerobaculia bacterium]|nr:ABC transporter permease [Thermoanaerobaculia bacterium]
MSSFLQDLRFAFRMLLKNPGYSLAAVAALALGIGLVTAMFSIIYGALLRGLPFDESENLMHLENANPSQDQPSLEVFLHDFLDWREQQKSFDGLSAYTGGTINLSGDREPERFEGAFLTANTLDMLRVKPIVGRGFLPGEDSPQAQPVVLLSYGVWRTRYQGDPKVVGRPVRVNGEAGTIIGVMPQGFAFPIAEQVWVPLRLDPVRIERGKGETLEVMGRLRQGVTVEAAQAEMQGIAKALAAEHPKTNEGREATVKPWIDEVIGDEMVLLLSIMFAFCFVVLLIGCTNVASLLMAKASRRSREIAIRSALGASRRRVVAQLLVESLLLAFFGTLVGIVLAYFGVRAFNAAIVDTDPPFFIKIQLDLPALLFAFGVTLLATVLAGLMPALQASRADLNEVLKDEGRGSSSLRLGRFSRVVVIGEVAFSCALLVCAGLMVKSMLNLKTLDLGFDPKSVLTVRIALFEATYPDEAQRVRFFDDLLARIEAQPGVTAVAATSSLPGAGSGWRNYEVEGRVYPAEKDYPVTRTAMITPSFFDTFGARLLSGRNFNRMDTAGSLPVVIVNKTFAETVWKGEDPIGKRIRLRADEPGKTEPWRTVVGVAPDLQMAGLENNEVGQDGFYLPLAQNCPGFVSVAVKTAAENPLTLASLVRQQVNAIDRDLPIYFVRSMDKVIAEETFFPSLFGTLFAILGLSALLLASIGIYGVIAFSVHQRTQEIGIRMALGAQQQNVLRMILRQGMLQLLFGLGVGLALALGASGLLANFLFGMSSKDPVTFTLVTLVLAAVAFLACWIPAQRASRTDPLIAIRYD